MHELAPLIIDLAVMLSIASVVVVIFQRIRQPVVLGYLVAGIIIGPYTPPHAFVSDIPNIKILSELGVIFLMFSLGLEFSFHKLMRVGLSASVAGVIEVVIMILLGLLIGHLIHWSYYDSLFLGAALAISSTTIIVKALDELKLKSKRFAELIFGILVVEDLLAILILVALSTIVLTKDVMSWVMVYATVKLILVVGGWFIVGYFLMPYLIRRISRYINAESLTVLSVALCLGLVFIAAEFNYSTALGAFIMGSILAETALVHRIEQLIRPIRDIFAAVFFISVGMLIDPKIILLHWPIVLLISLVTIIGKIFSTGLGALLTGQSLNTSVRVGFGMAQIGEFSFIIAGLGLALNATSQALYPIIVAVSAITTFTTPYFIRLSGVCAQQLEKHLPSHLQNFLNSYSAWIYRMQLDADNSAKRRKTFLQLLVNSIIVAIIFSLGGKVLLPVVGAYIASSNMAQIITWSIALLFSSPFIWGMLISYKPLSQVKHLDPRLFVVTLLTVGIVASLSLIYFHSMLINGLVILLVILFFALSYKPLEISYRWFERGLIHNLKQSSAKTDRYHKLAPWDTHFIEMTLSGESTYAGKTLKEIQPQERYGIHIVAIQRSSTVILAPTGDEMILPYDKLIVLGDDAQIEVFKAFIERDQAFDQEPDLLNNMQLKGILLDEKHPLVNQTIRASRLHKQVGALVVGLERESVRMLNPDPATVLQPGDLVFLVGEIDQLEKWVKHIEMQRS